MNQIYTLKKEVDSNKKLMGEICSTFPDKGNAARREAKRSILEEESFKSQKSTY